MMPIVEGSLVLVPGGGGVKMLFVIGLMFSVGCSEGSSSRGSHQLAGSYGVSLANERGVPSDDLVTEGDGYGAAWIGILQSLELHLRRDGSFVLTMIDDEYRGTWVARGGAVHLQYQGEGAFAFDEFHVAGSRLEWSPLEGESLRPVVLERR